MLFRCRAVQRPAKRGMRNLQNKIEELDRKRGPKKENGQGGKLKQRGLSKTKPRPSFHSSKNHSTDRRQSLRGASGGGGRNKIQVK